MWNIRALEIDNVKAKVVLKFPYIEQLGYKEG